jgi:hypothetical protein
MTPFRRSRLAAIVVSGAALVWLTPAAVCAQVSGLDAGSSTGDSLQYDPNSPDSPDMSEFTYDPNEFSDDWQPGQGGGGPGFGPNQPPDEALKLFFAVYGVMFAVFFVIALAVQAVICWLLYAPLAAIPDHCREMPPMHVWLMMIPCFNLIWTFFVSQRIPRSFQNYFAETGRTEFGDCGAQIGLWYAICAACSLIPCVNYIAGPASLVLLIIVIVKLWGLKGEAERLQSGDDGGMTSSTLDV